jgi:hypothetical protein
LVWHVLDRQITCLDRVFGDGCFFDFTNSGYCALVQAKVDGGLEAPDLSDKGPSGIEDFAAQYRALSDEAITQLAIEGGLRPESNVALQAEMRKRLIGTRQVRSLRDEQEKAQLQARVGHNPYFSYRGIGLRLRGHKFLSEADKDKEIIVVTRWIVFAFMPLIPLGSYRVMKLNDRDSDPTIVGKVRLQWDQVCNGWMQTGSVVILIGCAWLWFRWQQ